MAATAKETQREREAAEGQAAHEQLATEQIERHQARVVRGRRRVTGRAMGGALVLSYARNQAPARLPRAAPWGFKYR